MPDYERMYHLMLNAAEDALLELDKGNAENAQRILTDAERRAEEIYIDTAE